VRRVANRAALAVMAVAVLVAAVFVVPWEPLMRDRAMRAPAEACPRLGFSPRRCDAVIARAIEVAGVRPADVAAVKLGRPGGQTVSLGGTLAAVAELSLADGAVVAQEVWCIGIGGQYRAWCVDDPQVQLVAGANHDVPCSGEQSDAGEPVGCATPIALDPVAVAQARPLLVEMLDVHLTLGPETVEVGHAWLANGFLDEARFTLADLAPDGVSIPDGIALVIAPIDPNRPPFGNVYERGVFPGVEEVVATLEFDVVEAPPGTVLQVRDVVVR
jgi:hypothetical protein